MYIVVVTLLFQPNIVQLLYHVSEVRKKQFYATPKLLALQLYVFTAQYLPRLK